MLYVVQKMHVFHPKYSLGSEIIKMKHKLRLHITSININSFGKSCPTSWFHWMFCSSTTNYQS